MDKHKHKHTHKHTHKHKHTSVLPPPRNEIAAKDNSHTPSAADGGRHGSVTAANIAGMVTGAYAWLVRPWSFFRHLLFDSIHTYMHTCIRMQTG